MYFANHEKFGYIDEQQNFQVTDKKMFEELVKDVDSFKKAHSVKKIMFDTTSPLYDYHMGSGGHGRM